MKKVLYTGAALAMIMICVPSGFAGDRVNYVVAKTGGYIPTGDLDDADYDAGLTGEVAYGRYLTRNLVVEGGIGYFSSEADGYLLLNSASGSYLNEATMEVMPLTATLKGVFQSGPFDLYVGGGVGVYIANFEVEGDAYGGRLIDDDTDLVFGVQAMAGAIYNINEMLFAGIEGKYLITDEVDVTVFNNTYESNLDGFMISGQFGFRF